MMTVLKYFMLIPNLIILIWKKPATESFNSRVNGLQPAILLKRTPTSLLSWETLVQRFYCEICKPFYIEHLGCLLLKFSQDSFFIREHYWVNCFCLMKNKLLNSFMKEAVIIQKLVQWFALQINGLVSIW